MTLPSSGGSQPGTTAIDIKYLPAILLGISVNAVSEHLRPRLEEIQGELTEALYRYVFEGVVVNEAYVNDATAEERDAIDGKLRRAIASELVPIREASAEILSRVAWLPRTVEGLALALTPILRQIMVDENAPLAVRIGELIRAHIELDRKLDAALTAILRTHELQVDTNKRLVDFTNRDGRISPEQADGVRATVKILTQKHLRLGWEKKKGSEKSAESGIYKKLFERIDWGKEGQTIDNIYARDLPVVKNHLEHQMALADRELKRRKVAAIKPASTGQGDLFGSN